MNALQQTDQIKQLIRTVEPSFTQLAKIHGAVSYEREASFALQAMNANSYLASMAVSNPDSLKQAIINVAAVGLSLSPVYKLAYLVPRDKKVHLDISYLGYIHLAIECGAILWALAEVVREKDIFIFNGMGKEPTHKFEPFKERGAVVGAYCSAKTPSGEYIVTLMSVEEIYAIRDRSSAWKAYKKDSAKINPWVTDEVEMMKKTVIRRAYKSWPKTNTDRRFEQAIDVTSDLDPVDVSPIPAIESGDASGPDQIRVLLKELNKEESKFIDHLTRANKRSIKALEDLTEIETSQAIAMLEMFVTQAKRTKETKHENAG